MTAAGTPLEESKRRLAVPCLYALMGLYIIELVLTGMVLLLALG